MALHQPRSMSPTGVGAGDGRRADPTADDVLASTVMEGLIFFWLICGLLGALIGSGKKMGSLGGFLLGLLLGPIGLIIVAISTKGTTLDKIEARPAEAGWHDDPLGRFDGRYYDGKRWTQHVGRVEADGTRRQFEDPL